MLIVYHTIKKKDDPFFCLRGVELVEHDLYKLTSEMVEKKLNELPRINHCPSCEVHLVNVINEFCRECPECHRVFEYDDDENFQEVSPICCSLCSFKNCSSKMENLRVVFFQPDLFSGKCYCSISGETGKSVNYSCFLHNYFEMVPSEVWPCKNEIMESISHRLPNPLQ